MKEQTKKYLIYGGMGVAGIAFLLYVLKSTGVGGALVNVAAPGNNNQPGTANVGGNVVDSGDLNLGAPDITIIGGSNPTQWNLGYGQPTDGNGIGTSLPPIYLPVISNYADSVNNGCDACSQAAPDDYYASSIVANAAITAAMLDQLGYTKVNGHVYAPGYYNLNTGARII